jgi:hypothetical protein
MRTSDISFMVLMMGIILLVSVANLYGQSPIISLIDTLYFDTTFVGLPVSEDLSIQNVGNATLFIDSIYTNNPDFSWSSIPDSVHAGEQLTLNIVFMGGLAGQVNATLAIISNDPTIDTAQVVMSVYVLDCPPFPQNHSINVTVDEGDSLIMLIPVGSGMPQSLYWYSNVEFSDNILYPITDPGDTLFALDLTQRTPNLDDNLRGVTFDGKNIWISGANALAGIPLIYRFDKTWNLISSFPQPATPGNLFGFSELANDGLFLYGDLSKDIYVFDLYTGGLVNIITLFALSRIDAFSVDHYTQDYWATSWSSNIFQFDVQGSLLSVLPYNGPVIAGLGVEPLDSSPAHIWGWTAAGPPQGPMCTAVRLDSPQVQFVGVEINGDPLSNDMPAGIDVVRWDDTLTMLALQQSNHLPGDGHDFLVAYSLGYEWQEWLNLDPNTGIIPACGIEDIALKIYGIRGVAGETERTALITFQTNDPVNPMKLWTVTINVTPISNLSSTANQVAGSPELYQNYPNPFNSETSIHLYIPVYSWVSLEIVTPLGQKVITLFEGMQSPGLQRFRWDGRNSSGVEMANGVYFYRLMVSDQMFTRKMLLLK